MTTEFDSTTLARMAAIEANWDERTPIHLASGFYDAANRDPQSWFAAYEWDHLGDLTGRDVVHLQCHLGTETMAFATRGARSVTGLDLSGAAVAAARSLALRHGVDVTYVQGNVYDAADLLPDKYDIVYTGKGALCFLPDLDRWASVLRRLLRPGGIVELVEFHPMLYALGVAPSPGEGPDLVVGYDYLEGRGAQHLDGTYTYTDGPTLTDAVESYEWRHGLGEVVTALTGAGLTVTSLHESEELPWPRWPQMVPTASGFWRLPDDAPRVPLLYALKAVNPA